MLLSKMRARENICLFVKITKPRWPWGGQMEGPGCGEKKRKNRFFFSLHFLTHLLFEKFILRNLKTAID